MTDAITAAAQETGTETNEATIVAVVDIVSAYLSNNQVAIENLPTVIAKVAEGVNAINGTVGTPVAQEAAAPQEPAVPVRKSITPDALICLEDGRKFKSLKRHLSTKYNMTPDEYRTKWGLPSDYPMVAPNYAKARSELAKQMGLGVGGRKTKAAAK